MSKNFCKVENKWCKFCTAHKVGCKFANNTPLKLIHKCPKREADETCSFRELLFNVSFEDIMDEMYKYWPEEKKNYLGYRKLYTTLLTIKGKRDNGFICADIIYTHGYDDSGNRIPDMYTYVDAYCKYKNNNMYYGLDFYDWENVVTMNINKETLNNLTPAQIACGVFYEITFHGFTQEKRNQIKEDIYNSFEECKKNLNT